MGTGGLEGVGEGGEVGGAFPVEKVGGGEGGEEGRHLGGGEAWGVPVEPDDEGGNVG